MKAYFALPKFRDGAPFRPWLLKIVANEARNRRTARTRHPTVDLDSIADWLPVDRQPSPESLAIVNEQHRHLAQTLNQLREEDRAIIVSRYFLDLSEAELADVLGCRRGTVKSRLSRAMDRLRASMADSTAMDWRPDGV